MEQQYLVSARKYRPARFDDVVGQGALTTTLKNSIVSGKLAHAYLFCGPRGVGKTTCARIFAKNINCLNPHDGEACNECESCMAFNEGRSMNIYELDAASNNSVDDIRMIIEQVQVPPQIGKYKVYIIDEVHMLSAAAFNAFLKTLEEPPSYAIFILATTEKHKLLPTILSRCQIYDFSRMEVADIMSHLKHVAASEGIEVEEEALNLIARKADGGMRDALSIFDQVASYGNGRVTYAAALANLNVIDYDHYFHVMDKVKEHDVPQILLLLDDVIKKGFDPGQFIGGLNDHLRNLLVSRDAVTLPLLDAPDDVRRRYHEQAMKFSQKFIYSAMRLVNQCDMQYKQSRNKRLQVELTLILVSQLGDEGEDPYAGHRPAELKPVFAVSAGERAADKKQQPSEKQESAPQPVPRQVASEPKPDYHRTAAGRSQGVGFSIKEFTAVKPAPAGQQTAVEQQQSSDEAGVAANSPVDDNELGIQWRVYANKMPLEDKAISARMLNMTPRMISDTTFEVKVETDRVRDMICERQNDIVATLRKELHNANLAMQVSVMERGEIKIAVSPKEKLQELQAKNADVAELVKAFDLHFD